MGLIEENWDQIIEIMKTEYNISSTSFKTWIVPMKCQSETEDSVDINTNLPSEKNQLVGYLSEKYEELFEASIFLVTNKRYKVNFVNGGNVVETKPEVTDTSSIYRKANLVPKYTFENFIVGDNNRFALQACLAVAESPGTDFNPLFLYGGSGLGKTHLMNSIGHYILDENPDIKVLYVNSETFTNEVIESLRSGKDSQTKINKMREKYRNVDVLLIDDIQFIIGKESTQEEFFHTFNHLHGAGKAIIISSDKHPKQMETLDERFRSRFQWGLLADIQPPSYETRFAILLQLAGPYGDKISKDVLEYIASNIKSNIRELEGAFNKLIALEKLNKKPITLEVAEEALKDMIYPDKPKMITPTIIIQVVAEHYGLKTDDIISKKRNAEIVLPRQIAMYLIRELTDSNYTYIAKILEKKDHTTILHGIGKVEELLKTDSELAATIEIIKKKITPS